MRTFVETHFYDGGFRAELFPNEVRPKALQAATELGLKSTEAELACGEFALELAFGRSGRQAVRWLACYTRGFDLQHGDRGTYCGVGVWLIDGVLLHSSRMIGFLRDATLCLAESRAHTATISEKLGAFAATLPDLGWCAPTKPLNTGLCSQSELRSSYLMLPDNKASSFDLASIDVLKQFLSSAHEIRPMRRVYLLVEKSKVLVRETERLRFNNAVSYAEHLILAANSGALESELPARRVANAAL